MRRQVKRHRIKPVLQQRQQWLNLVLAGAGLGLWSFDCSTKAYTITPRVAEMLGYSSDEVKPSNDWWDERIHAEDLPRVKESWNAQVENKTPIYECEYRVRTRSGEWQWIMDRGKVVEWDEAGRPLRMAGICLDIHARRQAEIALQQRNRELELLNRASQAFVSSLDLDRVLAAVLEEVRGLLDVTGCTIWLVDPETQELVCRQVTNPQSQFLLGWRLAPGEGLAGWLAKTGRSLIVPDTRADARHSKAVDQQTGLEIRSLLNVPLLANQAVIGVLQVVDTRINRFTPNDLALVESLAATAAMSIENARLYQTAQELHRQARLDAETRETLLQEINHRVKNNLAAIIGLLQIERRRASQPVYRAMMDKLINRIQGLATAHKLLAAAEWHPILLCDLITQVITSAVQAMASDRQVLVNVFPSPVRVTSVQAPSLALIINELMVNSLQYAYCPSLSTLISVSITQHNETLVIEFRDNGPGYPAEALTLNQYNIGLYLVNNLIRNELRGDVTLHNDTGAVTTIRFKHPPLQTGSR